MSPSQQQQNETFLTKRLGLHTTIYSSDYSPCGNYLACGNNYGHIIIFQLSGNSSKINDENSNKPIFVFQGSTQGPIYHLLTVDKSLVACGYGPITSWSWSDLIQKKLTKTWMLNSQQNGDYFNCMKYNKKDGILLAGGSDIMSWDVKIGKKLDVYNGHDSFVHDLCLLPNGFASVSDDGSMRIWDSRSVVSSNKVEPYKSNELNRPKHGKYLSCIASDVNGDWIICGGGPKLALFRHNSLTFSKPLDEDKKEFLPNIVEVFNDEIIAGGQLSSLHRWHLNGERKAIVPCSVNSVFCMSSKVDVVNETKKLPLIVGGGDYKLSVFTNLGYESAVLKCV